MKSDKFRKISKKFPFVNQVVKEISCSKVCIDKIVNFIDKIEVQQIGQERLSKSLRNQYLFNKSDSGTEENNYDYERLFIVFDNEKVESKSFSALEGDCHFPIAHFFTEVQPKYLVITKIKECDWFHYYDRMSGRIIYSLEIVIFLINKDIVSVSKEIVKKFWERNSF